MPEKKASPIVARMALKSLPLPMQQLYNLILERGISLSTLYGDVPYWAKLALLIQKYGDAESAVAGIEKEKEHARYATLTSPALKALLAERNIPGRSRVKSKKDRLRLICSEAAETAWAEEQERRVLQLRRDIEAAVTKYQEMVKVQLANEEMIQSGSIYRMISEGDLSELASRRVDVHPPRRWDNDQVILELLKQDRAETLRLRPSTTRQRAARSQQVEAALLHNTPANVPIFKLAPELRNQIYEMALGDDASGTWCTYETRPTHHHLSFDFHRRQYIPASRNCPRLQYHLELPVIRTCKLFRQEMRAMYYAQQRFEYKPETALNIGGIITWLLYFGDRLRLLQAVQLNGRVVWHSATDILQSADVCVVIMGKWGKVELVCWGYSKLHELLRKVREIRGIFRMLMPSVLFDEIEFLDEWERWNSLFP